MLKPDRDLQSSLVDHIKQGSIIAQCEVVRDLSAYGWNKPLFGPIADFQRIIFDVLCQEWSIVDELPLAEASHDIWYLLKKGRVAQQY